MKILSRLAKNEVVRLNFYENFVNTGCFRIYRYWLNYYQAHEQNPKKQMWADAMVLWGDFLSKGDVNWEPFIKNYKVLFQKDNDAHPMLKTRVYGVALFCEELKEDAVIRLSNLLQNEGKQFKKDPAFTPFASLLSTQYLLLADQKQLLRQVAENIIQPTFSTDYIVKSIPFFNKLLNAYVEGINSFDFDEILMFQSGFTNEDYLIKAFALRFLKERDEESISDYMESITAKNGFALLDDISKGNLKPKEMRINFG